MAFTILSLCSGVGGLELGLRAAVPESRVVGYVERDSFAASVLLARMEQEALEPAPVWCGDLSELDWSAFAGQVDCLSAGIPCQPYSVAGKRKGTADERWIWADIVNGIRQVQPQFIFLENVPGFVTGGGLAAVLGSLAEMRYDAEWMCLRSSSVGASHKRDRFFLLAHSQDPNRGTGDAQQQGQKGQRRGQPDGSIAGMADTQGREFQQDNEVDTVSGSGNARQDAGRSGRELADTRSQGLQGLELAGALRDSKGSSTHGSTTEFRLPLFAPGPNDERWGDILELDSTVEPALCRDADGMAHRLDRLRACGNGVVPLQAAVAFVELSRRMNAS